MTERMTDTSRESVSTAETALTHARRVTLSCDVPVVLDTIRWYRVVQSKHD